MKPSQLNKNKKNNRPYYLISIFLFLTFSCLSSDVTGSNLEPTLDVGMIYTQAVITAQYEFNLGLTKTAEALPTLTPTFTPTSTMTLFPTETPTSTSVWSQVNNASCIPNSETETAKVVEVVDGDTIKVYLEEKVFSVRYIGIDTPEKNGDFYNQEATNRNIELVLQKDVLLIKDISEKDQYGRLLRYVVVDNVFVNLDLVEKGFARATSYPPDVACEAVFQNAEQIAKTSAIGLWQPPTQSQVILNTPSQNNSNCSPSYPGVCIPPPPPDLDCKDISYRRFQVLSPDPHNFDSDGDGIGCEN